MAIKNDAKFEEELTCQIKIDIENLTNFDPCTRNLKNLHYNMLLLTKVYNVWAKSTEELCLMVLNIDAKFEGTLTCAFEKFSFTG